MTVSIETLPCPDNRKNWTISIETKSPINILVCIIPDKLIVDHVQFKQYLRTQNIEDFSNPEEMLIKIIEDVNNAIVPKWVEITYKSDDIIIKVEDKQVG